MLAKHNSLVLFNLKCVLTKLLGLLICFLVSKELSAQYIPVPSTMSTPHGNIPITDMVYMPRYYGNNSSASAKYKFTIVLLNDSTITGEAKINVKDSVRTITFKAGNIQTTYKPSDTKGLYRMISGSSKLSGIPTDSCWLFKTEIGKVNLYSYLAELNTDYITAIQLEDNGPIVPLTEEFVLEIVKEYPKLVELVEKGKLLTALRKFNKI